MKKIVVMLYDQTRIELMGDNFAIGKSASDPVVITNEADEVIASFTNWNWVAFADVIGREIYESEPAPKPELPQ